MSWTPEKEKKLRELWKKGHSASQIASMLGDTTRNAVIGKAHRLNLEARNTSRRSEIKTNKPVNSSLNFKVVVFRSFQYSYVNNITMKF